MVGSLWCAASRTSGLWDGIVVTMSTKSSRSSRIITAASVCQCGTPNASAAARAFSPSRSQTAASSTSSPRSRQALRWLLAKKPQPISPARNRAAISLSSCS